MVLKAVQSLVVLCCNFTVSRVNFFRFWGLHLIFFFAIFKCYLMKQWQENRLFAVSFKLCVIFKLGFFCATLEMFEQIQFIRPLALAATLKSPFSSPWPCKPRSRAPGMHGTHLFFSSLLLCNRISAAWRRQMARLPAPSSNGSSTVKGCSASSDVTLSALWPSQTPSSTAAVVRWPSQPVGA